MAITEDASSPALVTTSGSQTITTASFTPPANSFLYACVTCDSSSVATDVGFSVSSTPSLTWTIVAERDGVEGGTYGGGVAIARAFVATSASMTVTATTTGASANDLGLKVRVLNGVDFDDYEGAGNEGTSGTNNLTTTSITPETDGLLITVAAAWNNPGSATSSDLTSLATYSIGNITATSGIKTLTAASATGANIDWGGTADPGTHWVQIEVRNRPDLAINWTRRVQITIPSSQVGSGGVTEFSASITHLSLPSEIFGTARSDGGDIRATSDQSGNTRLSLDIITFDASNSKAQLRVKLSLSSGSDNTFWLWYGNASATMPPTTAPFGQYSAYDASWLCYYAMEENPSGTAPQIKNRTSNSAHLTSEGTMTSGDLVDAKINKGIDFDGSNDALSGTLPAAATNWTIMYWHKRSGSTAFMHTTEQNFQNYVDSNTWHPEHPNAATGTETTGNWYFHALSKTSGGNLVGERNTIQVYNQASSVNLSTVSNGLSVARFNGGNVEYYPGIMDEIQYHAVTRAVAWRTTEYNSGNAPASFATAGSPESTGAIVFELEGFRFRNDDGSETAATWLGAQDANITNNTTGNVRVRTITNTSVDPSSIKKRYEYQVNNENWRPLT